MKKTSIATKLISAILGLFYLVQSREVYMFCTQNTDYLIQNEYANKLLKFDYIYNFQVHSALFAIIGLVCGFIAIALMLRQNENMKKFALASTLAFLFMLIYYGFFDSRWTIFGHTTMLMDNSLFGISLLFYFFSIVVVNKIKSFKRGY